MTVNLQLPQIPEPVYEAVRRHKYPLLFATVSGAHLYGFPSPDSDWDLRGVHILPAAEVLGLDAAEETISFDEKREIELDLVTHDVHKFFTLLLRPNGYVLEQLYSPIVVHVTAEHQELKRIARGCITRFHAHHYLGFASNQWKIFQSESPRRIKPLLYVFRVLLTGIHLMRSGDIEANLVELNRIYKLSYLPELIARKISGAENQTVSDKDFHFFEAQFLELGRQLMEAKDRTWLPAEATAKPALHELLVRLRLQPVSTAARPVEAMP